MTKRSKNRGQFSDRGYRRLFSNPSMVEHLVRSFVDADFVDDIDFSTLQRVNASFVTREFRKLESDIIWQVQTRSGPVFLYLLIEFQSTPDRFMALRVLQYLVSFYAGLLVGRRLRQQRKRAAPRSKTASGRGFLLPPVVPIVLYNGAKPWTCPVNLEDLVEPVRGKLQAFVPHFRYYLIAENELPRARLRKLRNLVAKMFLLETSSQADLVATVRDMLTVFRKTVDPDLQQDFCDWVRERCRRQGLDVDLASMIDVEVPSMLDASLEEFRKSERKIGRREGKQQGLRQGKETLVLQVLEKFGEVVDESTLQRIRAISSMARLRDLSVAFVRAPDWSSFLTALDSAASPRSGVAKRAKR